MTLDEAIKHCEEVANDKADLACTLWDSKEKARCEECANEHKQLAEWLKELKAYKEQNGDTISRQAAISVVGFAMADSPSITREDWNAIFDALRGVPSAQPEIIRCKDCRYYQDNNDGYPHINCKWDANETPDADDFCSGAERRTDE